MIKQLLLVFCLTTVTVVAVQEPSWAEDRYAPLSANTYQSYVSEPCKERRTSECIRIATALCVGDISPFRCSKEVIVDNCMFPARSPVDCWELSHKRCGLTAKNKVCRMIAFEQCSAMSRCPRCHHVVSRANKLWKIAAMYQTTVDAIVAVNPGINPDVIHIRQIINLPNCVTQRPPTPPPPTPRPPTRRPTLPPSWGRPPTVRQQVPTPRQQVPTPRQQVPTQGNPPTPRPTWGWFKKKKKKKKKSSPPTTTAGRTTPRPTWGWFKKKKKKKKKSSPPTTTAGRTTPRPTWGWFKKKKKKKKKKKGSPPTGSPPTWRPRPPTSWGRPPTIGNRPPTAQPPTPRPGPPTSRPCPWVAKCQKLPEAKAGCTFRQLVWEDLTTCPPVCAKYEEVCETTTTIPEVTKCPYPYWCPGPPAVPKGCVLHQLKKADPDACPGICAEWDYHCDDEVTTKCPTSAPATTTTTTSTTSTTSTPSTSTTTSTTPPVTTTEPVITTAPGCDKEVVCPGKPIVRHGCEVKLISDYNLETCPPQCAEYEVTCDECDEHVECEGPPVCPHGCSLRVTQEADTRSCPPKCQKYKVECPVCEKTSVCPGPPVIPHGCTMETIRDHDISTCPPMCAKYKLNCPTTQAPTPCPTPLPHEEEDDPCLRRYKRAIYQLGLKRQKSIAKCDELPDELDRDHCYARVLAKFRKRHDAVPPCREDACVQRYNKEVKEISDKRRQEIIKCDEIQNDNDRDLCYADCLKKYKVLHDQVKPCKKNHCLDTYDTQVEKLGKQRRIELEKCDEKPAGHKRDVCYTLCLRRFKALHEKLPKCGILDDFQFRLDQTTESRGARARYYLTIERRCASKKTATKRWDCRRQLRLQIKKKLRRGGPVTLKDCTAAHMKFRTLLRKLRKDRKQQIGKCLKMGNRLDRRECVARCVKRFVARRKKLTRPGCIRRPNDATCREKMKKFNKRLDKFRDARVLAINLCKTEQCRKDAIRRFAQKRQKIIRPACARSGERNVNCKREKRRYKLAIERHNKARRKAREACGKNQRCIRKCIKRFRKLLKKIALPQCAPRVSDQLRRYRNCDILKNKKARKKCRAKASRNIAVPSYRERRRDALKKCRRLPNEFARKACIDGVRARYPTRIAREFHKKVRRRISKCSKGVQGCDCRQAVVAKSLKKCHSLQNHKKRKRCASRVRRIVRRYVAQSYRKRLNDCHKLTGKDTLKCVKIRNRSYFEQVLTRRHNRRLARCKRIKQDDKRSGCLERAEYRWKIVLGDRRCRIRFLQPDARSQCIDKVRKQTCALLDNAKDRQKCQKRRKNAVKLRELRQECRKKHKGSPAKLSECYRDAKGAVKIAMRDCSKQDGFDLRTCLRLNARDAKRREINRRERALNRCNPDDQGCQFRKFTDLRETQLAFRHFNRALKRCKSYSQLTHTRDFTKCLREAHQRHQARVAAFQQQAECDEYETKKQRKSCMTAAHAQMVLRVCRADDKCAKKVTHYLQVALEDYRVRMKHHKRRQRCTQKTDKVERKLCLKQMRKTARSENRIKRAKNKCDRLSSEEARLDCISRATGGQDARPLRPISRSVRSAVAAAPESKHLPHWVYGVIGGVGVLMIASIIFGGVAWKRFQNGLALQSGEGYTELAAEEFPMQ